MPFNESNSVEHFFVHQLSGVNLNNKIAEPKPTYGKLQWQYIPASQLQRKTSDILLESELKKSLCRLNPAMAAQPEFAEDVIRKLRAILLTVNDVGLVRANETFVSWLRNEKSLPIGKNYRHTKVKLVDFAHPENNSYIVTNQLNVRALDTKIPDLVLFVNGLPLVVGEVKTPVRPAVSWFDGAHDIHEIYENEVPQLFVPNVFSFASEGKKLFIGAVRTPLEFWSPWRIEEAADELSRLIGLERVGSQLRHLLNPKTILDILQYYSLYASNSAKRKIKIVCRYQQYEGANAIVERVERGQIKKGLIWHFQGSGKSLLMLFAARKLRKQTALQNPTVLILVDRVDLDTQISTTFETAEVANVQTTDKISELHELLQKEARKIIITTIFKFKDAPPNMSERHNIIVLVDEAHRTQEGNLGRQMRAALPNAFLFGLTGTPINKAYRNTFWAFGAEEDESGYMSRYTFQDSIRDKATLPLHFEPRLPDYHIDKENLDKKFDEMAEELKLSKEDKSKLSQMANKMSIFLKAPKRVAKIVGDIADHFQTKVQPLGFKAMIVTPDRDACVQYKVELDKHFATEASKIVMSTTSKDSTEFKQKYGLDKEAQGKVVEEFNDAASDLQFLIVTSKLLTGFDAPILQTMYLDKSFKDHTLLQTICRTNRLFPDKSFGRIVDYYGVFDDTAEAFAFDKEVVKKVITNLQALKEMLPTLMHECLKHFPNVDRDIAGFEGLELAQNCLNSNEKRDAFAKDYGSLSNLWEALSPDEVLTPYEKDYKWLSNVYESVKPVGDDSGRLLWHVLGPKTTQLIHQHIQVKGIHTDMETLVLDAQMIDNLINSGDEEQAEVIIRVLVKRLRQGGKNPKFKALSKRLEALRDKAEQGLINSVAFVKELCEIAKEALQAEKEVHTPQEQKTAKTALTELFLELKTDQTPAIVERIVNDIDAIVKTVRYDGWQHSGRGEQLVQKELRRIIWVKYKIKDQELFDRAYGYIKEYY